VSAHSPAAIRIAVARQFLAFAAVGACGTVTHYATLIAGVSLGIDPVAASALGWTLGAVVNYSLNYRFTFRSGLSHREAAPRFAVVAAIGLLLNTLLMATFIRMGLHYLIAQVIATGVVLCCNFLLSRVWAFRERPRSATT
jgi:putative flippase GtrA